MRRSQRRSPTGEYGDSDIGPRDLDDGQVSSDPRIGAIAEGPDYYAASPPTAPRGSARYRSFGQHRYNPRPSVGRRIFTAVSRFFIAVLIGIGGTLGWQSYGDKANATVAAWAPSLSWLLPVSTASAPPAPATLSDLEAQLKPLALDLAIVRRNLEQLGADQNQLVAQQEQIAQNISLLQQVGQENKPAAHTPPRKSPLPIAEPTR